jgi:hypothetical protein
MIARREAIRRIVIATAGAALLPACVRNGKGQPKLFNNLVLTSEQEELIPDLAQSIIPGTNTPGAIETHVPEFMARIVDDCFTQSEQQKFTSGLGKFEVYLSSLNANLGGMKQSERDALLNKLEDGKGGLDPEVVEFYNNFKKLAIRGYTTSEYYMTEVQHYKMIPGKYKGCVPVKLNS